ncbi:hypothetical protein [Leuconostoc carnosum]|uniref:hypothetical protein n=1 Tax=Leuconostoc carnosum TaxID=1252 RepID=UPI0002DB5BAD|nr:hypothetical protein [Leuconostoc carnosum]
MLQLYLKKHSPTINYLYNHNYPYFSMILLNTLSNNKAIEISEFIRGYRAGKKTADKAH